MEANLVHGEGDHEGEPFRLAAHGLRALYRWYEYDPDAHLYLHRKGLIGWPKGSSKTEWEAAVGLEHLEGPSWSFGTPVVTCAAVDGDQADELVRIAGMLVPKESELRERLEINHGRILCRFGEGRMVSTTAALGKNEGRRTSLLLCDELHEWDAHSVAGARRHGVLERNTNKRRNGRQLNVTTAGWSLETLAGAMYSYGTQVASGEVVDAEFLFDWYEASPSWDLEDPEQLLAAIFEANPMADVAWPALNLVRSYREHRLRGEVHDFVRYHLNRWVEFSQDIWMDMEAWRARGPTSGVRPPPPEGTKVVLGFDGSVSGDSTALIGATVAPEPYVFVVGIWEADERASEWEAPITEVEEAIVVAANRWNVATIAADVSFWQSSFARLGDRGLPVERIAQHAHVMNPACQRMYEAVTRSMMTHDGDPRLTRHVANCRRTETEYGVRVSKGTPHSRKHIDAAIAAVMAFLRAAELGYEPPEETPELISF